jgi:hypothetical protein
MQSTSPACSTGQHVAGPSRLGERAGGRPWRGSGGTSIAPVHPNIEVAPAPVEQKLKP